WASSNMSRMDLTLVSTRSARPDQSSRSITPSKAPTWNQSSTSTDSPLTIVVARSAPSRKVIAFTSIVPLRRSAAALQLLGRLGLLHFAFDPFDQHRQRLTDRPLLVEDPRFETSNLCGQRLDLGMDCGPRDRMRLRRKLDYRLLQLADLLVAPGEQCRSLLRTDRSLGRLGLRRRGRRGRWRCDGRLDPAFVVGTLGLHFLEYRAQHDLVDPRPLLDRTEQQQAVGNLVDPARDAPAGRVELDEDARLEMRIAGPADLLEPVDHVWLDLVPPHRLKVMRGDYPLAQLLERGIALQS